MSEPNVRHIGVRHRVKTTTAGESRPTQAYIEGIGPINLKDLNDELDFAAGRYPIKFRAVKPDEDLSELQPRHIKWRVLKAAEDVSDFPASHVRPHPTRSGVTQVANKVPKQWVGPQPGDIIAMSMGGSGDGLAFRLSKIGATLDPPATVIRITPTKLNHQRADANKDDDAQLLAQLAQTHPELFYETSESGRAILQVRLAQGMRTNTMRARIAAGQRALARARELVYLDGELNEEDLDAWILRQQQEDTTHQALLAAERAANRALERALKATAIYHRVFIPIHGAGPSIAGRIIAAIGNFERFLVEPDQEQMDALYMESQRLEREVITPRLIALVPRITKYKKPGENHYHWLRKAASWCKRNQRPAEAAKLERAAQCHNERSQIRRKARQATQSKLKAYCGAHMQIEAQCPACLSHFAEQRLRDKNTQELTDTCLHCGHTGLHWQQLFAKKRKGRVSNWHHDARQALYLLVADQFANRQAKREDLPWAVRVRELKRHFRKQHPIPLEVPRELRVLLSEIEDLFNNRCGAQNANGKYEGVRLNYEEHDFTTLEGLLNFWTTGRDIALNIGISQRTQRRFDQINETFLALMEAPEGKFKKLVKIYTDPHLKNMAIWRTASEFVEHLADEWTELILEQRVQEHRRLLSARA